MKKLLKALLTLTAFSVLTRFLGFLYKIYLSRIMTTTELGMYNLTLSIYMVLITIVASSIPLVISRIASINRSNHKEFNTYYSFSSSLILTLFVSIILSILVILLKPLIIMIIGSELGYLIIISLIPSIIFSALYSQVRGYLWGYEHYFGVSMVEFIEQILRIIFCMIFVYAGLFSSPVIAVGTALSIACGISTGYGFYLYFKHGGKLKFKKGYMTEIISSSLPLTGVRLFSSLLQPIIAVVLPLILATLGMSRDMALSELGIIMGMSLPLISIPSTIIGSLCMILVPKISSDNSQNHNLHNQIDNYILFSLICLFTFFPAFIVLGEPICKFVFDNSQAGIYLSSCAWIIIPMGIAQITTSILNALNQEKKSFIYFVISSIFMFLAILILPKFIGIMSMAYAIGISNIILALLNIRLINKLTQYQANLIKKLSVQLLISLPVILISRLTYNWLHLITPSIISIGICGLISVLAYFALLIAFNIIDVRIVKNFIFKRLKSRAAAQ